MFLWFSKNQFWLKLHFFIALKRKAEHKKVGFIIIIFFFFSFFFFVFIFFFLFFASVSSFFFPSSFSFLALHFSLSIAFCHHRQITSSYNPLNSWYLWMKCFMWFLEYPLYEIFIMTCSLWSIYYELSIMKSFWEILRIKLLFRRRRQWPPSLATKMKRRCILNFYYRNLLILLSLLLFVSLSFVLLLLLSFLLLLLLIFSFRRSIKHFIVNNKNIII